MDVRSLRDAYTALYDPFQWAVPSHFNIAQVCGRRWAEAPDGATRTAIVVHVPGAPPRRHAFATLQAAANRLSNALARLGVARGDAVAMALAQGAEAVVAHLAVLQMGAVAVPLSVQFGADALQQRLDDAGARVALADAWSVDPLLAARARCPQLETVIGVGEAAARADHGWQALLDASGERFEPVDTLADDPALLLYTSGTSGPAKGVLLPHRALIGNLSGFICSMDWFGFDPADALAASDALLWTPADWSFGSGLMNALLPALYFGRPVVAWPGPFAAQEALALLQLQDVTHALLPSQALREFSRAVVQPGRQARLRTVATTGEALDASLLAYCRDQLGVTPNELYSQTELGSVVGHCARFWPPRPGSLGRPYPGHRVAVLDEDDGECPVGVRGELAVNRLDRHGYPDPAVFLGYRHHEGSTHARFSGDWCRTGDLAERDTEGYLWFRGRVDDLFKAGGLRIGPGEVEACLRLHPTVADAAVVPKPDRQRGAVVKAYVVLAPQAVAERGNEPFSRTEWEARLVAELQAHVGERLAPGECPQEIEFIDALPMTVTGRLLRRVLREQEELRAHAAQLRGDA